MIDRRVALGLGAVVLGCVFAVGWWLVTQHRAVPAPAVAPAVGGAPSSLQPALQDGVGEATGAEPATRVQTGSPLMTLVPPQDDGRGRLRGIVLLPDGRPASGAEVTLYRQTSAWPEWRRVMLDTAITGSSGTFQFPTDRGSDLLVDFRHLDHAGGLCEAPPALSQLVLRLQTGFSVDGIVLNDQGRPMAGVRVALESMLADDRSVRTEETTSSGRFRFTNVAIGAMRVVARDRLWQPVVRSNVVVGVDRTLELRFDRPALSLMGRVVAAATQEPIGGARIYALPPGQDIGRNDAATAMTNADGYFQLAGLAPGNLRLEVRHDSYGTVSRTLVVGPAPTPLAIDMPARTRVRGNLHGPGLELARGAMLTLRSAADELALARIAADGAFEFATQVTPGWGTLSVDDGRFAFPVGSSIVQVRIDEIAGGVMLDYEIGPPAVVAGRIVDAEGAPIADARITARQAGMVAERLRQAGSALLDRDLRRFGDQLTRSASGGPEQLLAVSAADGRFRVSGLPPGSVELRIAREGYGGKALEVEVPQCGVVTAEHRVDLQRAGRIRGHVQRGGRPLAGAQVGLVVDGSAIMTVSNIDGGYELRDLPAGEFRVRARYSTFPTVLAKTVAAIEPGGEAVVDLEFPPGRAVRGTVTGLDGQPVEGAFVLVRGEPGDPVVTDSSGAFALEAPNRAVELQIAFGDRGVRQIVPVDIDQGEVLVQIDAPPNCTITARLLGIPGRKALAGVLMRIARAGGDNAVVESRWIELHGGELRYPWFPAGDWQVTFWCEGYAPVRRAVELLAGQDHAFGELLLETGCELRGVVLDEGGRPLAGAEVFLGEEGDLDVYEAEVRSGADGTFALRGVSSLAATIVVRAPGYAWRLQPLRLPGDVLGGAPVEIRLERGATIEVQVTAGAAEGSTIVLRRGGRVLATAEVGADGRVQFANRGAGEYLVQRFGDERQQVRVTVDRSGDVVRVQL